MKVEEKTFCSLSKDILVLENPVYMQSSYWTTDSNGIKIVVLARPEGINTSAAILLSAVTYTTKTQQQQIIKWQNYYQT